MASVNRCGYIDPSVDLQWRRYNAYYKKRLYQPNFFGGHKQLKITKQKLAEQLKLQPGSLSYSRAAQINRAG